jgi:hypothetical protein
MAPGSIVGLALLGLAFSRAEGLAEVGPGEASAARRSVPGPARNAEFKVLVWYHQNDPLGTFKCEIYDLRREQNIAGIDAWVKEMRAKFPLYVVSATDVDLKRAEGATEALKVGSVIKRELMIAAARAGVVMDVGLDPRHPLGSTTAPLSSGIVPQLQLLPGSPAGNRATYANSPLLSSPLISVRRPP